jgi:hypothetical protein
VPVRQAPTRTWSVVLRELLHGVREALDAKPAIGQPARGVADMSLPTYRIVVPSRKRPHNMETIRWLLPSATIVIDERERADYAPFVPAEQLVLHPPFDGLPRVINWCMEHFQEESLVFSDDDLQGVQCNVGHKRYIVDAEEILAVIENTMQCCADLRLTCFCWSRTPNTTIIRPDSRPIVPTQLAGSVWGCMGAARKRHYDEQLTAHAAVDWTLRTLLQDRCIYTDVRYYFDVGRIFSGAGGNVGVVTPESYAATTETILRRWGKHVSFQPPAFAKKGKRASSAISIRVSRTNAAAQK